MADSLNRRRWSGWCLVPGPVDFVEPEFSFDMQDHIAEYRASLVAEVALSIPGVAAQAFGRAKLVGLEGEADRRRWFLH